MKSGFVLGFVLFAISAATLLPCSKEKGPMPKSVVMENCNGVDRCEFIRGALFKADVTFTARN